MPFLLMLGFLLCPYFCSAFCTPGSLTSIKLFQNLTVGAPFMADKGGWSHHMTHSASLPFHPDGILYDRTYTRLRADMEQTRFRFNDEFFMSLYVKPCLRKNASMSSKQLIFAKRNSRGGAFLELWLDAGQSGPALIVVAGNGSVRLDNFFVYGQYVRVGVKKSDYLFTIYQNLTASALIDINDSSDELNQEMYLGGDMSSEEANTYFYGRLKQLTIWSDSTMHTFPMDTTFDQLCSEEYRHDSMFQLGPGYYWPAASYFGSGWFHVRRLMAQELDTNLPYMRNAAGALSSDSFLGTSVSRSLDELKQFGSPRLTQSPSAGQYSRYFEPWKVEEFLVVTGDRTLCMRFEAVQLRQAIRNSSFPVLNVSTSLNFPPHVAKAGIIDMLLGTHYDSQDLISLVEHEGVNVFVRLRPHNFPRCGDSFRTYPEECDDGNTLDGDGCSSECKVEIGYKCEGGSYNNSLADVCAPFAQCGDGVISGPEECDDSNLEDSDGCSSDCKKELSGHVPRYIYGPIRERLFDPRTGRKHTTGKGSVQDPELAGYWMDRAAESYRGSSSPWQGFAVRDSEIRPVLNDGYKTKFEACDDGNSIEGDGCNNGRIEYGWKCVTNGTNTSVCVPDCGDGYTFGDEECDPPSEGCSAECRIVAGYCAVYRATFSGLNISIVSRCDSCGDATEGHGADRRCLTTTGKGEGGAAGETDRNGSHSQTDNGFNDRRNLHALRKTRESPREDTRPGHDEPMPWNDHNETDPDPNNTKKPPKDLPPGYAPANNVILMLLGSGTFFPNVNVQSVITLLEVMQLLSLFSVFDIEMLPHNLGQYYTSLRVATLEFLPNIFCYILPREDNPGNDPRNRINESIQFHPSLEGKAFLLNIGNVISTYILMLLFYPIILLASKACPKLAVYEQKYRKTAVNSGLMFSFMEILLSACVQIKYLNFSPDKPFLIASSLAAIFFLIVLFFFTIRLFRFYYYLGEHVSDAEYMDTYSSMISDYRHDGIKKYTTFVLLLRLVIVIPLLVFFANRAVVQTIAFLSCNLLVFFWHGIVRPAESKLKNALNCMKELFIIVVNIIFLYLAILNTREDNVGDLIIIMMSMTCFVEISMVIVDLVKSIVSWWKRHCMKAKISAYAVPDNPSLDQSQREIQQKQSGRPGRQLSIQNVVEHTVEPKIEIITVREKSTIDDDNDFNYSRHGTTHIDKKRQRRGTRSRTMRITGA